MANKLFVGGLSFSTSTERLRDLLAEAGTVESARPPALRRRRSVVTSCR